VANHLTGELGREKTDLKNPLERWKSFSRRNERIRLTKKEKGVKERRVTGERERRKHQIKKRKRILKKRKDNRALLLDTRRLRKSDFLDNEKGV